MNGLIFFEDGTMQVIGTLSTVRLIAAKIQEVLPNLVQQERDLIINSLTESEIRRAVERFGNMQKQQDLSDE